MPTRFLLSLMTLACFTFIGCESSKSALTSAEWQAFEGEVVWVKTSRGFWAIEATKVGKINPLSMPEDLKVNGLKIRGEVKFYPEAASARNWGTVGEVRALKRIGK